MPSLWGVVHELANGAAWPPADDVTAAKFLDRVNQESLLPLYFDDPPDAETVRTVSARYRALERAHTARSRMIIAALDRLGDLLKDEPMIVLKGCDFAFRLYSRPELRPMADVDVLVPDGELGRIASQLQQKGLVRTYPSGVVSRVDTHHEAAFTIDHVTVEIHHRFIQRSRHRIDYAGVWKRAQPFQGSRVRALRLSPADAVAYLSVGLSLDYFVSPLIRYVDLWRLIEDAGDQVLKDAADLAAQWKAKHAFYSALRYGARLFPEFAAPRFESAMAQVLGPRSRSLIDRYVVPRRQSGPKIVPSRGVQLWRKFWTMDSMLRRSGFAAEHMIASLRGRFAA